MSELAMGFIGLGGMGRAHLRNLQSFPDVKIAALCDVDENTVSEVGHDLGISGHKCYTKFQDLIYDPDVAIVVSVTPNHTHAEIIRHCLEAGKPFMSEKPFTRTYEEAVELLRLYKEKPVPAMVGFSHRYLPSYRYAKHLIANGQLGSIRHVFVQYLQGWGSAKYNYSLSWRMSKAISGTGALGDLGSHMIDMARYMIGEFQEVSAELSTFIKERQNRLTQQMEPVDVDDYSCFLARLEKDVMGVFQTSRNAFGSENQLEIAVYGDYGTIHASTENPQKIFFVHGKEEGSEIVRETLDVPEEFITNQWEEFIHLVQGKKREGISDFMDGYYNQEVLEMVLRSSEWRRTVTPSDVRPEGLL